MPDHIDPPHATGEALKIVEAHSKPHQLVFHAVRPPSSPPLTSLLTLWDDDRAGSASALSLLFSL
jgi:hypothetical protein